MLSAVAPTRVDDGEIDGCRKRHGKTRKAALCRVTFVPSISPSVFGACWVLLSMPVVWSIPATANGGVAARRTCNDRVRMLTVQRPSARASYTYGGDVA